MAMLGLSCRREVEASLDSPSNELSLPCKQEVQNALSGFSHDLDAGEVPRIPEETGIVKHQRAIGASFVAAALVAVLARFVQRRRKGGGGSSKKKKSRPPSKKKASLMRVHGVRKGGFPWRRATTRACRGARRRSIAKALAMKGPPEWHWHGFSCGSSLACLGDRRRPGARTLSQALRGPAAGRVARHFLFKLVAAVDTTYRPVIKFIVGVDLAE